MKSTQQQQQQKTQKKEREKKRVEINEKMIKRSKAKGRKQKKTRISLPGQTSAQHSRSGTYGREANATLASKQSSRVKQMRGNKNGLRQNR